MGFFSKVCVKTNKPVVHQLRGFPALSEVVALYPDGRKITGSYDGYGRVDGEELCPNGYDEKVWNSVKFVLINVYEGEEWKDLPKSRDELAQGHFMDDKFLRHCQSITGFKDYAEYKRVFKTMANW
jgi:hypothetical protein